MDLLRLQTELRKRTRHPYTPWGRKQNDEWDHLTRFIYQSPTWDILNANIQKKKQARFNESDFTAYAINRWFNFWSAKGVEEIFCRLPGVIAAKNERDRLVDFSINGINFDHKTSVFPKTYPHNLEYAIEHQADLIRWLYQHQSKQQRMHLKNRLFIILYDTYTGAHWKLRAELLWLQGKIESYVEQFSPDKLTALQFDVGQSALADIIWAVRE